MSKVDLSKYGIKDVKEIIYNPSYEFLYEEEINEMFNSINTDTLLGKRDYAILEFMYGTGVRVSELCSIEIDDIDYINKQVIILGKGNKERYLPLSNLMVHVVPEPSNKNVEASFGSVCAVPAVLVELYAW